MLKMQQTDLIDIGHLRLNIHNTQNIPIENATINISLTGSSTRILEQLTTDSSGLTPTIDLAAPPIELSLDRNNIIQPYSEYSAYIEAPGYEPLDISGIEILSDTYAEQPVQLVPIAPGNAPSDIVIPAHTLYGDYPSKIPEDEIKPTDESGEIVLSRVVIPETVIVHDGAPSDNTAKNYYVRYTDYIKNVASSEIYATWPESTITANILAIMSFTLNRVYTEWYGVHHSFMVAGV